MKPMVSIIWINYNSMSILDRVLESIRAALSLNYPRYEVIIIDNGSTDKSPKKIRDALEKLRQGTHASIKFTRLSTNKGFTGGANEGFQLRNRDSKYVVLLNNDAVPEPDSLATLVEIMEAHPELGAAQGVIIEPDTGLIDTAGGFLTEYLAGYLYRHGEPPSTMSKPIYVTYADGAYSIWRVSAVLDVNKNNKLFYDELFAYCDDNTLGAKLWTKGYPVASFPYIVARHKRGSTFKKLREKTLYLAAQCQSFLYHVSRKPAKTRYLVKLLYLRRKTWLGILGKHYNAYINGWKRGRMIATKVLRNEGTVIDLEKTPLLRTNLYNTIKLLIATRLLKPDHDMIEKIYAYNA